MPDALTPDEIENARFTTSADGYDRDEVEVFLKSVAADVRALLRAVPRDSEKPYYEVGHELADLIRHAQDAAEHIKKGAEEEAALLLQDAQRTAKRARDEAEQTTKRAEKEASVVREEAFAAAERYREQAEKSRRLAEAERSIAEQERRRETKRLKEESRRQAQEILARAKEEAAERTSDSERRLRRLQEAEVAMRRRATLMRAKLDELTGQVKAAQAGTPEVEQPKTIYLDDLADDGSTNGAGPASEQQDDRRSMPFED
jgi:DivIVA domain-containing protein